MLLLFEGDLTMNEENETIIIDNNKESKEQTSGLQSGSGYALAAFILMVIGFEFAFSYHLSFVGVILGILALALNKETEQQPFKTFRKFTTPFAIAEIAVGAVLSSIYVTVFTISLIAKVLG